jgi:hypothetical protein
VELVVAGSDSLRDCIGKFVAADGLVRDDETATHSGLLGNVVERSAGSDLDDRIGSRDRKVI